jgi:hypothetical protein
MPQYLRNLMAQGGYMAPEGGDGGGGGGAGGSDDAQKAAAQKTIDDAAAAKKVVDDAAGKSGRPSDEEAKLLKEVMAKKELLKTRESELAAAQAALKQFDGVDIEAIKKLMADQRDAETKKLEAAGEWDRLKKQMAEEHQKQIVTIQTEANDNKGVIGKLQATISELTIGSAFGNSPYVKDELLIPHTKVRALFGAHFENRDGKVVAFDKPSGASERTELVDGSGNPLSFEDALKKIVDSDPDGKALTRSKIKPGAKSGTGSMKIGAAGSLEERERGTSSISQGLKAMGGKK